MAGKSVLDAMLAVHMKPFKPDKRQLSTTRTAALKRCKKATPPQIFSATPLLPLKPVGRTVS
jgi:hypothetical protein